MPHPYDGPGTRHPCCASPFKGHSPGCETSRRVADRLDPLTCVDCDRPSYRRGYCWHHRHLDPEH